MTAWVGVAIVLAAGLGSVSLMFRRGGDLPLFAASLVLGVVVVGLWQAVLDIAGVPWSRGLLAVPGLIGLVILAVAWQRGRCAQPRYNETAWGLMAFAPVFVHCVLLVTRPAFGWDFRYNWGLKAKVFALAGAHDLEWLAWPAHRFAHPDYPPLWPDLLASAVVWGADASTAAAVWSAVVAAGLAVTCWHAARGAPGPVRALAAIVGGWAPVILAPRVTTSGYAEAVLAFFASVALLELVVGRGASSSRLMLAAATLGLALTKNEGFALAVGVGLGHLVCGTGRRRATPLLAAVAAFATWRGVVAAAGVEGEAVVVDGTRMLHRAQHFMGAAVEAAGAELVLVGLLWLVILTTLGGREVRAVWIALAVWAVAVAGAYLVSPHELGWHLATSAGRVLAVPVPVLLALALGRSWTTDASETATE